MADQHDDGIEYEEISEDDTVVGRAFRISIAVFFGVAAVVLVSIWIAKRGSKGPPPVEVAVEAPREVTEEVTAPVVRFVDVTKASGIDFVHENGAEGDKLLPETMGSGAAFIDYDRDGDPDLLLVDSCPWPGSSRVPSPPPTMRLYANDGHGSFADVTAATGLDVTFYGMGAAGADTDCDGDVDLFFTAVGPNHFFRNDDGRYGETDVGVRGDDASWSTCAAFFDADLDGDLDLFVGNYVRWSREIDIQMDYRLTGIGRAYGPPMNYEGAHPYFYENDGAGGFSDVTAASGLQVVNPATGAPSAKTLGVRPTDADLDGDLDLVVANDTVGNCFFENQGDGTFQEEGTVLGLAYDRNGMATGAMGIDAAWYRDDGALGIAIGNFANEMSSLYVRQERSAQYLDEAISEGVGAPSRKFLSFGLVFLDYDLDGRPDLLQANGHLESEINLVQASQTHAQPAQLFWNAGQNRRTFVEADASSCGDLARPVVGRGVTYADVDADGDLDVLITQTGGAPLLLRNDQDLGHHWLRLKLQQEGCNPDAIGARVEVEAGGKTHTCEVMPTRSYLSQVELPLTFGLGTADHVDLVRVHWPDGTVEELTGLEVDRQHLVRRGP